MHHEIKFVFKKLCKKNCFKKQFYIVGFPKYSFGFFKINTRHLLDNWQKWWWPLEESIKIKFSDWICFKYNNTLNLIKIKFIFYWNFGNKRKIWIDVILKFSIFLFIQMKDGDIFLFCFWFGVTSKYEETIWMVNYQ